MLRRAVTLAAACNLPPLPAHIKPPPKYAGPAISQIEKSRQSMLFPVDASLCKVPFMLTDGRMQYVFDHEGRRYLDMFGGVCSICVGHAHPRVTEAVREQAGKIVHTSMLYYSPPVVELMELLTAKLPKDKKWVFHFTSSGSEANDWGMMIARASTKNYHIASLSSAYHGGTEGSRCLVGLSKWKQNLPPAPGILRLPSANAYRGCFGSDVDKYVTQAALQLSQEGPNVAGFWAEPMQGLGGLYPLLEGYLPRMFKLIRERGGICCADEVQTGFARLGSHYFGFEKAGVTPDLISCAKSIANGYAMGLSICNKEVADRCNFNLVFNTFGGNPISAAAAVANIKAIEEDKLQENAVKFGATVKAGLLKLQKKHACIGDIRGDGFIMGVEMINLADKAHPIQPAPADVTFMGSLVMGMRQRQVIIGAGGEFGNCVRLQGPMCSTLADAEYFLDAFDKTLESLH